MEIDLHITNRCNLVCKHCVYSSGERDMPDLKLDTLRALSGNFKMLGANEIHLTGGEPLLNPQVYEFVEFLASEGFNVRMQTNGQLINQETAKRLVKSGLTNILISIDGTEQEHNSFRNSNDAYQKATEALKHCLDAGLYARVNTVVCKSNQHLICELMESLTKLKPDQHSFFYLTPLGRGRNLKQDMFTLNEWKIIRDKIFLHSTQLGCVEKIRIQDVYHENDIAYTGKICRNDNILIMCNGDVFHCVLFSESSNRVGNIFENSLYDIWSGVESFISRLIEKRNYCSNDIHCGGGCPGMAFCLTGSTNVCDPRCMPAEKLISNCIRRYRKI